MLNPQRANCNASDMGAEHMSGAENGSERAECRVSGNGAVSGDHRKRWSVNVLSRLNFIDILSGSGGTCI
jgi:hypothetical protein